MYPISYCIDYIVNQTLMFNWCSNCGNGAKSSSIPSTSHSRDADVTWCKANATDNRLICTQVLCECCTLTNDSFKETMFGGCSLGPDVLIFPNYFGIVNPWMFSELSIQRAAWLQSTRRMSSASPRSCSLKKRSVVCLQTSQPDTVSRGGPWLSAHRLNLGADWNVLLA